MTRATWRTIIASRDFYVKTYKRALFGLIVSIVLNLVLVLLIVFVYLNRNAPSYYASNGMTAPMLLSPLKAPNDSSAPLLGSEPTPAGEAKYIPG